MAKCRVAGCKSGSKGYTSKEIKLYRFPRDDRLLERWKSAVQISDHTSSDRVCNLHFSDKDFVITNVGWKVLAPGAVPSRKLVQPYVNLNAMGSSDMVPVKNDHNALVLSQEFIKTEPLVVDVELDQYNSPINSPDCMLSSECSEQETPQNTKQKCSLCNLQFDNRLNYMMHSVLHSKARELIIERRQEVTETYVTQLKSMSSTSKPCNFFCSLCGLTFDCRKRLRAHNGRAHTENPYPIDCNRCGIAFENHSILKKHVELVHLEGKSVCSACDRVFSTASELWLHLDLHGTECECPECCKEFCNIPALISHLKSHKSIIFLSCDFCPLIFSTENSIEAHLGSHNIIKAVPVKCDLCNHATSVLHGKNYHEHMFLDSCETDVMAPCKTYSRKRNKLKESASNEAHPTESTQVAPSASAFDSQDMCNLSTKCTENSNKKRKYSSAPSQVEISDEADKSYGNLLEVSSLHQESNSLSPPNFVLDKIENIEVASHLLQSSVTSRERRPMLLFKHTHPIEKVADSSVKFACKDCTAEFISKDELVEHQQFHKKNGDFTCIECGALCQSSKALSTHYEQHVKMECDGGWSSSEDDG